MSIRLLHSDELDAVLDRILAITQAFPLAPQWPRSAWIFAFSRENIQTRLLLVAFADTELSTDSAFPSEETITGLLVASLIPPQAELELIAVAPAFQRGGVAYALLAALDSQLVKAGILELNLEVRTGNQSALALYRQADFIEVGRRPGYYTNPIEDALLLRRLLF